MTDKAHAALESTISDIPETRVTAPAMASSESDQTSLKFEQVIKLRSEEVVTWLQQTSFFTIAGKHALGIKDAIISYDLSGDVLLRHAYDCSWLERFLPTFGACDRLSFIIRQLYDKAGIPLPASIITTTVARATVHEQDHSCVNTGAKLQPRIDPTPAATGQVQDDSSTNAGRYSPLPSILLRTRIGPILVTPKQEQDHSSANSGILLPTSIEPAVVTVPQEHDHSSSNPVIPLLSGIESTIVTTVPEQDQSSVHAGIQSPTSIEPTVVTVPQEQDHSTSNDGMPLPTMIDRPVVTTLEGQDHSSENPGIPLLPRIGGTPNTTNQGSDNSTVDVDIPTQAPPYILIRLPRLSRLPQLISDHRYHLGIEFSAAFALAAGGFHLSDWSLEGNIMSSIAYQSSEYTYLFFSHPKRMADRAYTTSEPGISDTPQTRTMVPGTASSKTDQISSGLEQFMEFTAREVVALLERTGFSRPSGPLVLMVKAAFVPNDLSFLFKFSRPSEGVSEWLVMSSTPIPYNIYPLR
ncbi:hypothetical protein L873DRAFT_1790435 [Choiromyces venosus 120613-1]|uniref:Uncharacterized protein n=1 Tax=Choiromyces venosus 120613-1 TaxID=1336337 RepID=A0A3N4JJ82_9PEZI|nr:hypothetical protein L873DRAFT_1790435 [Choiromyces venosus 120613-1]